jgi:RNA-directed DNA polymerase
MAEKAKESIIEFLKPLGLTLNERKTTIAEINEGIDLLGFNIREYPDITRTYNPRQPTKQGIVIVKPSMKSIENFRLNVKTILKALAKSKPGILIQKLNPYIRG